MNEIIQIAIYLGAFQGFLLAGFLFFNHANRIANRLLALLALCWGIILLTFALQEEGLYTAAPHLLLVTPQLLFLLFPLLFLYIKYLLTRHKKFKNSDLWHFTPFFLSIVANAGYFLQDGQTKLAQILNPPPYLSTRMTIMEEIIGLQGIVYSVLAILLVRNYKRSIQHHQSAPVRQIIQILSITIALNLISWLIGIVGTHLEYFQEEWGYNYFNVAYLILVVTIYTISYAAIRTPELFKLELNLLDKNDRNWLSGKHSSIRQIESPIHGKGTVQEDEVDATFKALNERLIQVMECEKPFLNPVLNLSDLAARLDVSRNQLSLAINQVHSKNFYEFINTYRVEEVVKQMRDPGNHNLTIVALANNSGFNSKASFYRVFKQFTGMTPTAYMQIM
jgi:AraC-like DNA-binding protein